MKVFIVGAGSTGVALARLLQRRGHDVWCGDRDEGRCRGSGEARIVCEYADARSMASLVRAARGCELLVNAVPAVFNEAVIQAALRAHTHYLDMASHLARNPFKAEQLRFHEQFQRIGRLALIDAGAAPGLTNVLVALCVDSFEEVTETRIRLFEDTQSSKPISTWSPEVAFDEAISKPCVYRRKHFRRARRFSNPEWFRFPPPIGEVRVVLIAQDEVATLPRFIPMTDLDVKAGGNDIERLRRWHRRGELWPSDDMSKHRFPATDSSEEVRRLMQRRVLLNACFAIAVSVIGRVGDDWFERRRACVFPSLRQLRNRRLLATPIAYAAAECAAAFIEHLPRRLAGAFPPEALPVKIRRSIVADLRRKGLRFHVKTRRLESDPSATDYVFSEKGRST